MIVSMNDSLSEKAIREQLRKLLASQIFARSERLGRFLRFTVDQVLAGKQDGLKEYVIGIEVYDRRSPYHPAVDSIVRSEARRLRGKLKQYYEFDGKTDPVRIFYRPGSYIPEICLQEAQVDSSNCAAKPNALLASSGDVIISVERFVDLSGASQATLCASGVTAELLHLLMETKGSRVVARAPESFNSVHPHLYLEGDVRQYDSRLRITCRMISAEGFQLASHRFDVSAEAAGSFTLQEEIAAALVSRIARHRSLGGEPAFSRQSLGPAPYLQLFEAEGHVEEDTRGRIISMVIPEKRTGTGLTSS
jgi:TolB-like protein